MPSHRQQLRHLVRNNIFTRVYSRICDTARDGGVGGGSSEILNILCLQLQCKLYVHTVGLRSAFISQGGKYIFCNYYFFIISPFLIIFVAIILITETPFYTEPGFHVSLSGSM